STPMASVTATTTLTDDLNAGLFSATVQQFLQGTGVVLTGGAVSVQGGDGAWSVSGGVQAYRIAEANGNLEVRRTDGPVTRTAVVAREQIRPAVVLTSTLGDRIEGWAPRLDLLGSAADAREFVAESEHDGNAIVRFGDDVYGKRPES